MIAAGASPTGWRSITLTVSSVLPCSTSSRPARPWARRPRLALGYWPWSLLSQPEPLPERLLGADPQAIIDDALAGWGSEGASFPDALRAAYVEALRDPRTVHAICEEYRAAATLDFAKDMEDLAARRRIACPVLVLCRAVRGKGGVN